MIYLVSTYQFARSTSNRSKRQKRSRGKDQSKSFIPLNPIRYMPGSNPFERTIDHQVQRMAPLIRVWKFHAGKSMPCLMNSLRYNSQQSLSNTIVIPKQHLHLCIRSTYNRFPAHSSTWSRIPSKTILQNMRQVPHKILSYTTRSIESSDIKPLFLPQK